MKLWKREIYYFDTRAEFATEEFAKKLMDLIIEEQKNLKKTGLLFLCIGTDRSTGDSLGPLIGHKLAERNVERAKVFGTLEQPVHAMNLDKYAFFLKQKYPDYIVVAVDASVGSKEHVGYVTMGKGALKPGLGVKKELCEVGDLFITGIVGGCGNLDPVMLQSVRLSIVMRLADYISESICLVEKFWDTASLV